MPEGLSAADVGKEHLRTRQASPLRHPAERRFRPEFQVAFDAWLATSPETNPQAPPGPTYMPEYVQPGFAEAAELDRKADASFAEGSAAGETSDQYVR